MDRREFLSQSIAWPMSIGVIGMTAGCGTIFYNERVGMPHSNQLDWKIVALDALGLIVFFVPGVIAFVVDFATGAIYLPPIYGPPYPHSSYKPPQPGLPADAATEHVVELRPVAVASRLDQPTIEAVVSDQIGRPVLLTEPSTRISQLASLEQFAAQRRRHERDHSFGQSARQLLERLLPG